MAFLNLRVDELFYLIYYNMLAPSDNVHKALQKWKGAYVNHDVVYMPPGWKDLFPVPYTFVYVNEELTSGDYVSFFRVATANNLVNPRLFSPRTLYYASCFHPSFYRAVQKGKSGNEKELKSYIGQMKMLKMNREVSEELQLGSVKYWLQTVIFLAGVTLSAAIIQNRWSVGTLESKLSRLWQLAQYKEVQGLEILKELNIETFVLKSAGRLHTEPLGVLKDLKLFYSQVLKHMIADVPSDKRELKKSRLSTSQKERFGFIKNLENLLGKNMQCVIVYGSATNSDHFADYDLIIVVKKLDEALEKLAGKSPVYNGLELNISLFDEADFNYYQLASGDNLANHALCLYGSIMVPHKPSSDLVARNFSFGFVRFRQLLGMAAHYGNITSATDDKLNLLNYFIKIPMNVFKGIQGCYGSIGTNEEVKEWSKTTLGFDVTAEQEKAKQGFSMDSIATAAWATQEVMNWFDKQHTIFYKEYTSTQVINSNQKISL